MIPIIVRGVLEAHLEILAAMATVAPGIDLPNQTRTTILDRVQIHFTGSLLSPQLLYGAFERQDLVLSNLKIRCDFHVRQLQSGLFVSFIGSDIS